MRRALASVILGGALLATAACGGASDSGEDKAAAPDYSANTKTVCTSLEGVLEGKTLQADTAAAVTEAVKGKTAKADIEKATITVMQEIFTTWAGSIAAEGAKAEDPQFKADVTAFADALKAEVAKIETIDGATKIMDGAAVTAAGEKLDKYCG